MPYQVSAGPLSIQYAGMNLHDTPSLLASVSVVSSKLPGNSTISCLCWLTIWDMDVGYFGSSRIRTPVKCVACASPKPRHEGIHLPKKAADHFRKTAHDDADREQKHSKAHY
jgi:hypothetical protein